MIFKGLIEVLEFMTKQKNIVVVKFLVLIIRIGKFIYNQPALLASSGRATSQLHEVINIDLSSCACFTQITFL